jgi:hypothetical protein
MLFMTRGWERDDRKLERKIELRKRKKKGTRDKISFRENFV